MLIGELPMVMAQNIHCIGDRANKVVLDIYSRLISQESWKKEQTIHTTAEARRPRIEHAQIMQKEDLIRVGELGGRSLQRSILSMCSYEDSDRQRSADPRVRLLRMIIFS